MEDMFYLSAHGQANYVAVEQKKKKVHDPSVQSFFVIVVLPLFLFMSP